MKTSTQILAATALAALAGVAHTAPGQPVFPAKDGSYAANAKACTDAQGHPGQLLIVMDNSSYFIDTAGTRQECVITSYQPGKLVGACSHMITQKKLEQSFNLVVEGDTIK